MYELRFRNRTTGYAGARVLSSVSKRGCLEYLQSVIRLNKYNYVRKRNVFTVYSSRFGNPVKEYCIYKVQA